MRLEDFEREQGLEPAQPLPLATFIDYGEWFRQQAALEPDARAIDEILEEGSGFRLTLDDGDVVRARNVVVAAGIEPFAWRPPAFMTLPPELVSHSVEHDRLDGFGGRRVVVIGAGQSAIEYAALLHEGGAEVTVIARAGRVNWLVRSGRLHRARTLRRLLYAPSDIGPAGVSWLVELPHVFRRIPRRLQDPLARRAIRPAASHWLLPRTEAIAIRLGRTVVAVTESDGTARLRLDDGSQLDCDHVMLATGYRVDITRYPFLASSLLDRIARADGYPRLDRGFQSSVRGLYFVGAPAAWSFGPLFRFVAGAARAAPAVAASLGPSRGGRAHSNAGGRPLARQASAP
jgi:thioredoxin reductase